MNQYSILKMAREAGAKFDPHWGIAYNVGTATFERFAALIEQHLSYDGIHTCHDECQRPACVAVREAVATAIEPLQERITDLYRQLDEAEKQLDRQYKLGMEAEREACAQLCESRFMGDLNREDMEARRCAAAIRARGEK